MKRILSIFLALIFAAVCAGCQISSVPHTDPVPDMPLPDPTDPPAFIAEPENSTSPKGFAENMVLSRPEYPAAESYDNASPRAPIDSAYLDDVRAFAFSAAVKALKSAADPQKSAMTSPMSLYFVLAMLADSATGASRDELFSALGVGEGAAYTSAVEAAKLYESLNCDNEYSKCAIYNSLWLSRDLAFNKTKLDELAKSYYAESIVTDFASDGYKNAVAQWISERTDGFLNPSPDAFDAPKDPPLIMMLINTVYFKSEWMDCFSAEFTKPDTFTSLSGAAQTCDFMNATRQGSFYRGEGYTTASLSLKDGFMRFILPDEGVSPMDILNDSAKLDKAVNFGYDESGFGEVVWKIPKFKFDTTFDLTNAVKQMGFDCAFDGSADFSALTDADLFISRVSQGSRVAIDENGIEAAAYTDMMACGSALPTDKADMILDRPFIFVIENEGVPLFVGIVNEVG